MTCMMLILRIKTIVMANTVLASDASREAASYYTNLFNYLLPPGGIAMIPVVGFVLVEWGFAPSFLIIAILHLLFCIVNAFDQPPLQLQVRNAGQLII